MEYVLVELESVCEEKMRQAIETEEGLGIEYDEDVVCDVCRSPEGEDGNEMVFCDKCNVCVHQVRNKDFKILFSLLQHAVCWFSNIRVLQNNPLFFFLQVLSFFPQSCVMQHYHDPKCQ